MRDNFDMRKQLLSKMLLALCSTLFALILCEAAYRAKLHFWNQSFSFSYRVVPEPHGVYSESFGLAYVPESQADVVNVTEGKVTWCPEGPISVTNKDGLNGVSTYDDYRRAQYKIAVFGDSFTHWNRNGSTWPDLLQIQLSTVADSNVVALNYGRGGYGILQMIDLAGAITPRIQPDLTIIAFITDDLTRDRWWAIDTVVDGIRRDFLSPNKKDEFHPQTSRDRWLIEPQATPDWCKTAINTSPQQDAVLASISDKLARITSSGKRSTYRPTSLNTSYLLNRILRGTPFPNRLRPAIPRHSHTDFSADEMFVNAVNKIVESSQRVLLVHLPSRHEIHNQQYLSHEESMLASSLELAFGREIAYLGDSIHERELPVKTDLRPHDGHPNFDGLVLYAKEVSEHLINTGAFGTEGGTSP